MSIKISGNTIVSGNVIVGNKRSVDYVFQAKHKITCLGCKHFWFVQGGVYGQLKCQKCGCDAVSIASAPYKEDDKQ